MIANANCKPWMPGQFEPGLISVIMPTYNRAALITEAMDSVWRQTYRPIELIVVDDGSKDGTADVVEEWRGSHEEKNDFQVRYFYQDNAGPSSARNYGLIESQGEFIQFLDSDDLLHPLRFEKLTALFQEPACDFIQTGFEGFCAKCGKIIEQHYGNPSENQLILALKGRLWANTLRSAFRRSLVVATGPWNEGMTCFEDYEYVVRALVQSRKSIAIREIFASARRGGGMRVSDHLKTYTGRTFRIMCEEALCRGVFNRVDVPFKAKQAFASRLYALGFRSNASGWPDLGKRCGGLAKSLEVKLDTLGRRRRLVYSFGKWGGLAYELLGWFKERATQHNHVWRAEHVCSKN